MVWLCVPTDTCTSTIIGSGVCYECDTEKTNCGFNHYCDVSKQLCQLRQFCSSDEACLVAGQICDVAYPFKEQGPFMERCYEPCDKLDP